MTAKRKPSAPPSATPEPASRSAAADLTAVHDRPITFEEYLEIPEWTEEDFAAADLYRGGVLVRRGRPRKPDKKVQVTLRLSPRTLDWFRASGPGWQRRIDEVLAAYVSTARDAAERAE